MKKKIFFSSIILIFIVANKLVGQISTNHYFDVKKVEERYELICCIESVLYAQNFYVPDESNKRIKQVEKSLIINGEWRSNCLVLFDNSPNIEKFKRRLLEITIIPVENLQVNFRN